MASHCRKVCRYKRHWQNDTLSQCPSFDAISWALVSQRLQSHCASRDTFLVTPISTEGGGLCYGHARIKDTRKTTSINAPAEYDHASTGEEDIFCEPVASIDSWLFVEMLEMDFRTLLGLAIVDSNSAKSCFVAMSLSSIADIESARGFVASIGVLCALLDEVWM